MKVALAGGSLIVEDSQDDSFRILLLAADETSLSNRTTREDRDIKNTTKEKSSHIPGY